MPYYVPNIQEYPPTAGQVAAQLGGQALGATIMKVIQALAAQAAATPTQGTYTAPSGVNVPISPAERVAPGQPGEGTPLATVLQSRAKAETLPEGATFRPTGMRALFAQAFAPETLPEELKKAELGYYKARTAALSPEQQEQLAQKEFERKEKAAEKAHQRELEQIEKTYEARKRYSVLTPKQQIDQLVFELAQKTLPRTPTLTEMRQGAQVFPPGIQELIRRNPISTLGLTAAQYAQQQVDAERQRALQTLQTLGKLGITPSKTTAKTSVFTPEFEQDFLAARRAVQAGKDPSMVFLRMAQVYNSPQELSFLKNQLLANTPLSIEDIFGE